MARLEGIDQRVKAPMKAEAHDRIGQSMALAAQIRKAGYAAKRSEVPILSQLARDFDDRTYELFRLGWLDQRPATEMPSSAPSCAPNARRSTISTREAQCCAAHRLRKTRFRPSR